MNTRSLRFQLVAWHAGLLTAVFLLCGGALAQVLGHYMRENLADALRRRIDQVAGLIRAGAPDLPREIESRYTPGNYDRCIRVSRSGAVIYTSGRAASFDPGRLPPPPSVKNQGLVQLSDGTRLLVLAQRVAAPSGAPFLVECGGPMQPIDAVLHRVTQLLLLGVPVVLLAAIAGGHILVGRALAPVGQITRSAEQITLQNLAEKLPVPPTGDELEQLSAALNKMIARLRGALEQNHRFLADASHELRTPLTTLRGELENASEQARHSPELRDKIGSALEEVDRLAKIVQTLFSLSRLDAGEAQQEWRPFDLAPLAAGTVEQMSLLAEDKGVAMTCETEAALVAGDGARIKQVMVNLIDNAIKYTPAGGGVRVRVSPQGRDAVLEVADTGIGIPAAALPHVFERFYRVDKARSRDDGGAGLGLAIVKSICAAHGGQVEVSSEEGKGSRFVVRLPLAVKN